MRTLILAALVALAAGSALHTDLHTVNITKDSMVNLDIKSKQVLCMKLLNHILQPTIYDDVREVARDFVLEDNLDKFLKVDVVHKFMDMFKMGLLPRGEVFVHSNELQLNQAVQVFKVLYFAKDFDTFIRAACFLRERINGGMFVYAFTCALFHRTDCQGIVIPAPYEIYPYFFVDSDIIHKAFMMKMSKAAKDPVVHDYYGIKVTDDNLVVIDWRKGVRHSLTETDRTSYFTEDVDLNTYMYNLHMSYPFWMTDDVYGLQKERRGETYMYALQQLSARMRLERLSHKMCDMKMIMWDKPLKTGYWPKILLPNGEHMPVRRNNVMLVNEFNMKQRLMVEDIERIIREGILNGRIERRDGTIINLKKTEDFEYLARLLVGGIGFAKDDAKVIHVTHMIKNLITYGTYNLNKYTYIPTALDMYSTCLRDPLYWMIIKRIIDNAVLFKNLLPKYTKDELDFPGVKVEKVMTDKLVTFMDEYDLDMTNALYLDQNEIKNKRSDMVYVARTRRLNNQPFKVTVEVMSDKAVDAVVRVFIGPKFDCMGRILSVNDKRMDMVEIDSFLYKLETGKNTIVRDSMEMHGVIGDRTWTRRLMGDQLGSHNVVDKMVDSYWYKTRIGMSHRLLLPLGLHGGLPLQMFVVVTPARTGKLLTTIDLGTMKERRVCRWAACIDSMPLGFPFDRELDVTTWYTRNMKFTDVLVYYKDMALANVVKDTDMSDMVMKRDDLTYLETDLLRRWSYRDVMMTSADNMTRL